MTNIPFIDIHTHHHRNASEEPCVSVINLFAEDDKMPASRKNTFYSMGLHPWHISSEKVKTGLANLEQSLKNKDIIAIGETGLDRAVDTPMDVQKTVFEKHLLIAQDIKKPIIVHCVRAYPDVVEIYKNLKVNLNMIFHGFGGNLQTAGSLIRHGFYLSFGGDLMKPKKNAAAIFKMLPKKNIFLETDESEYSIGEIYHQAALLMEINVDELKKIIHHNFLNCFGKLI